MDEDQAERYAGGFVAKIQHLPGNLPPAHQSSVGSNWRGTNRDVQYNYLRNTKEDITQPSKGTLCSLSDRGWGDLPDNAQAQKAEG